jgi:hypothetical protein
MEIPHACQGIKGHFAPFVNLDSQRNQADAESVEAWANGQNLLQQPWFWLSSSSFSSFRGFHSFQNGYRID